MHDSEQHQPGQAGAIEITPEMIDVGTAILMDMASETMTLDFAQGLARDLFSAMAAKSPQGHGQNQKSAL